MHPDHNRTNAVIGGVFFQDLLKPCKLVCLEAGVFRIVQAYEIDLLHLPAMVGSPRIPEPWTELLDELLVAQFVVGICGAMKIKLVIADAKIYGQRTKWSNLL